MFENKRDNIPEKLAEYARSVVRFNMIAGKLRDPAFQETLCEEELKELIEAWDNENEVEFLFELVDCWVVASYAKEENCNPARIKSFREDSTFNIEDEVVYLKHDTRESSCAPLYEDLIYSVVNIVRYIDTHTDWPWEDFFEEKLASNMSKFSEYHPECVDEYDKHCHTLMEGGRYTGVTWDLKDSYVVWHDDKGKILKGIDYFQASVSESI